MGIDGNVFHYILNSSNLANLYPCECTCIEIHIYTSIRNMKMHNYPHAKC